MVMWERSERSEKEGKYSILKDITGCSEKTVRCDEAQRKCCIFTVYWGKGSHQVHGLVGAVLWNAEFLMYHQYWKL